VPDEHPVRTALLDLLRARPQVTSAEAARELGGNTGQHSFHLRRLAELGLVEEVPGVTGRSRPWRLRVGTPTRAAEAAPTPDLGDLNRSLEDESYQRWLERRDGVGPAWRRDEAFSEVLHLTPRELTALAVAVRALVSLFRHRETDVYARPAGSAPVAVVARLFPMLDSAEPPSP
jgi:hypothetical protein